MNLKVPGAILPLGCAILSTRAKTVRGLVQPPLGELGLIHLRHYEILHPPVLLIHYSLCWYGINECYNIKFNSKMGPTILRSAFSTSSQYCLPIFHSYMGLDSYTYTRPFYL